MKKIVLLVVLAMMLMGCTAKDLSILQKTYTLQLAQQSKEYVAIDAVAPAGLITRTVVIYDDKGKQEYADTESVGGPFNRFMDQGFQGMAIGGGLAGLGATMPGNNYSGGNAYSQGGAAQATGGNAAAGSFSSSFSHSISNASAYSAPKFTLGGCW